MKTKVHCVKALCCGLNRSQETGSVAYIPVTLTAEYCSAIILFNLVFVTERLKGSGECYARSYGQSFPGLSSKSVKRF